MGNIATLKPWKKGQSGNPKGKPKGTVSLVTKLREALDRIHKGTGKKYDELLVESIMKDGIKADGQSRRLIIQYLEGMPKETKDVNLFNFNNEQKEASKKAVGEFLGKDIK